MATGRRVKRLRDLAAQIELLPVSPERDRLLSEFRSRAVDVDTGVTPRAMLPVREPALAQVPRRPPPPDKEPSIVRMPERGRSKNLEEPSWVDERLSLEDSLRLSPLPDARTRSERIVRSWTLGLRG